MRVKERERAELWWAGEEARAGVDGASRWAEAGEYAQHVLVLVLDTATPAITAAVVSFAREAGEVRLAAERVTVDSRAHGELLSPQIDAVLAEAGAKPRDLGAIIAGLGPGPFTGLRAGLVTAAMMGAVLDIPTYGVCTLDAIAADTTGDIVCATDARRKEVYWGIYHNGRRVEGPEVNRPADLVPKLAQRRIVSGIGDGVRLYAEVLQVTADRRLYPPALGLARLAADRIHAKSPGEVLTPLYLRRPDAEMPGPPKKVAT